MEKVHLPASLQPSFGQAASILLNDILHSPPHHNTYSIPLNNRIMTYIMEK